MTFAVPFPYCSLFIHERSLGVNNYPKLFWTLFVQNKPLTQYYTMLCYIRWYNKGASCMSTVTDFFQPVADANANVQTVIELQTLDTDTETEAAAIERIAERFSILEDMASATKNGDVRGMIVVGPPGVGKSFGITKRLAEDSLFDTMAGQTKFEVVKGAITPIGLYKKLYEFKEENSVLVFDDCDSVLLDELMLNLMKAALDSGKKRTIHWNAESRVLAMEDIPNKFEFKGAVIFITNINFDTIRSKKLKDHLGALQSRCHYIDLSLNTMRDCFLRIKQISQTGQLFTDYKFDLNTQNEVLNFMWESKDRLREMSLRSAIKIADLRKAMPDRWQRIAEITVMKNTWERK